MRDSKQCRACTAVLPRVTIEILYHPKTSGEEDDKEDCPSFKTESETRLICALEKSLYGIYKGHGQGLSW